MTTLPRAAASTLDPTARRRCGVAVAAVLASLLPALAWADCVDTCKPTAAEQDFHDRAMAALVAALPPPPIGAKLQGPDTLTSLGQQCQKTTGDFSPQAVRSYDWNNARAKAIVSLTINATRLPVDGGVSGAIGPLSPKRSSTLRVNNVVWAVSGAESPLRQALVDAIDRGRLQGWVGQPLPSVAESQALAAKAVPATVGGPSAAAVPTNAPAGSTAPQAGTATPASPGAAPEQVKDVLDTVNKVRGLFGR